MIKKNDPLVNAVQKIMEENALRYQVEQKLCEELGIYSKNALPNEHKANFAALLDQRINEALHPNQRVLDVEHPKGKLDAKDFKALRAKKKEPQGADMDEEEQLDEISHKTYVGAMTRATDPDDARGSNPDKIIARAKREKGEKFAKNLGKIDSYSPRSKPYRGKDSLSGSKYDLKRVKNSGVMYKQDQESLKNKIKGRMDEEEQLDELKGIKSNFRKLGYLGKASKVIRKTDPKDIANDPDTERKFKNRMTGLKNLLKRTQKEEVEEGGETREGGAVTTDKGKAVVSPTAMKAELETKGPSASDRSALTNKIKSIMKEAKEKMEMDEAAKSKSQQRLFGAALATRRGESEPGSRKIAKLAADVSEPELKKFAGTKLKDLPEKKKIGEQHISFDSVMEEIGRKLGKMKVKEIEEQDEDPNAPYKDTPLTAAEKTKARTSAAVMQSRRQTAPYSRSLAAAQRETNTAAPAARPAAAPAPARDPGTGEKLSSGQDLNRLKNNAARDPGTGEKLSSGQDLNRLKNNAARDPGTGELISTGKDLSKLAKPNTSPAPAARPAAAPAARPTAAPAPAARPAAAPVDPNAKSKSMFQAQSDAASRGDDNPAAFFAADKQRTAELKGMRENVMNESLADTIRNILKG